MAAIATLERDAALHEHPIPIAIGTQIITNSAIGTPHSTKSETALAPLSTAENGAAFSNALKKEQSMRK